jgi:hypothetical protein
MAPLAFHQKEDAMILARAHEIIATQLQFGGGYNRNAVRLLLGEVQRAHGQPAVDGLIREFDLETVFGLEPGTDVGHVGR